MTRALALVITRIPTKSKNKLAIELLPDDNTRRLGGHPDNEEWARRTLSNPVWSDEGDESAVVQQHEWTPAFKRFWQLKSGLNSKIKWRFLIQYVLPIEIKTDKTWEDKVLKYQRRAPKHFFTLRHCTEVYRPLEFGVRKCWKKRLEAI